MIKDNTEVIYKIISDRCHVSLQYTKNIIALLDEGATVPFISRYRKERTGTADEVQVLNVKNEIEKLRELEKRKETIITTIESLGLLTDELQTKITDCFDSAILEDIYLPYKPKRRTKATIAKEKGLEPLAQIIYMQATKDITLLAEKYINDNVESAEEAIQGAMDIIAEWISENTQARDIVRNIFNRTAEISSKVAKGKDEEGIKYKDYFDTCGVLRREKSHRIMAMFRGEKEGFLKLSLSVDDDEIIEKLERLFIKGNIAKDTPSFYVKQSIHDSYKRLLKPSIESETYAIAKENADKEAINVFADNLRQLLLASPLGQKRVLAIDPGYRTGCKIVCLSANGDLLHNDTIYPHQPQNETAMAIKKISSMVESYKIEAIAIGDGTASRESEAFIKKINFNKPIEVYMVSEDGASVYSASSVAREEFPTYDVTVRGAVSIGRRLMDPLSELVKIDPKSIGVGQYQHDVNQISLKTTLDDVVVSCVNSVGVNLNTASYYLLSYVSGLGPSISKNIVKFRSENGNFASRQQLLKVPRLGNKAYEQCAGFLRIKDGSNPLDGSAVHPESYHIVEKMAKDLNSTTSELISDKALQQKIDPHKYIDKDKGLPTILDIISELAKPGLDPRNNITVFEFAQDIHTINDVKEGMTLPGIVTNITNFGAFVDIGVKQDGLVHISQLTDKYVANVSDVVKLHQHVTVRVTEVDIQRSRIQLSMKL